MQDNNKKVNLHNTNIDYKAIRALAISRQPLLVTYPLSAFDLGRNRTIKIDGKLMPCTDQAYNQFIYNVLKVPADFAKKFKNATDEKTELTMLQTLKSGMALKKNVQVQVLADPLLRVVTGFSATNKFMTNEAMLSLFEIVMNRYGALGLKDFYLDERGNMKITARSEEETEYMQNEQFKGGLTFSNTSGSGSDILYNALRLICTNGMTGFGDAPLGINPFAPRTNGGGGNSLDKFFTKLDGMNASGWMFEKFKENMEQAMKFEASVAEFERAKNAILNNSSLKEKDINAFLPVSDVTKYLAKRGVDMAALSGNQMKNCPIGMKLWDLINVVTDFGSHDYGFDADFGRIQHSGGTLLVKEPDVKNLVIFN